MTVERPTRRSILKGIAASVTLTACRSPGSDTVGTSDVDGGGTDASAPVAPPDVLAESAAFSLGVSAGDLDRDRGVLWTQYTGSAPLAAILWRMQGDTYAAEHGPFAVTPADGGYAHVAVEGLVAGARYRYAFVELGADGARLTRSRIGRFRAPIADTASEVITIGALACTEQSRPTHVLARAAERVDLDFFVFAGDNAYCDGATTVDDYRAKYTLHFGRADHVALRAQQGMYITWDDHEVKNDWNPETIDTAQLGAAFQAFFDHAPISRVDGSERRIWRSARWGHTVEVFVLDCRSERKPSTIIAGSPQYISAAQLAWLKAGLAASPATFKLIVNSVPITNMPFAWDTYPVDRWEAYGAQRLELLSYIDDNSIDGVVWLSGDFHLAFISRLATSGPGSTQHEVLAGPGGQSANALLATLQQPQFSYATGTNNYTTLRFTPATREVTVGYHNAAGVEFHTESFIAG